MASDRRGGDLFIVDNSDPGWTGLRYLQEWCELSTSFDIATGYFDVGAVLALDGKWQGLQKIRILMGADVMASTQKLLLDAVRGTAERMLDAGLEAEKDANPFLNGVAGIVDALRSGQIECRIFNKAKFHAKAHITHAKLEVVGAQALVGSSNFTRPGLTQNVELNIQVQNSRDVEQLQQWFDDHWREAVSITDDVLTVVERHARDYSPFDVWAKALAEFFRGHEETVGEWERSQSRIYPLIDQYQRDGYQALKKIADQYGGAFLCDGVGLGKTYIGLMVIERLLRDRKKVALFVPKAARIPVWERRLRKLLPELAGDFSDLVVFNHTDQNREGEFPRRLDRVRDVADAIVIDEAHHFRNQGIKGQGERKPSRYRRMYEIAEGKQLFLLTATPVNNRLIDLQHMIELFSRRERPDYFRGYRADVGRRSVGCAVSEPGLSGALGRCACARKISLGPTGAT